jgi:hypothetical protein
MPREELIRLVRSVIQPVLELFSPQQVEEFDDDFAAWTLGVGTQGVAEKTLALTVPARGLDTTLVAGMFFQVMMEASRLPAGPRERVSFVRKKAKDYLVTRLAGQITLSQFYRLLNLIEEEVDHYFARQDWSKGKPMVLEIREPALPSPEPRHLAALRRAMSAIELPVKGRRKLTPETLWDFLRGTEGRWFRLLDFEASFQVNKKTAWSYLHLLLQKGMLIHNGERANRVRYALAAPFQAGAAVPEEA